MAYSSVLTVTAPLTLTSAHDDALLLCDATSAVPTITFPAVSTLPVGFRVTVKKIDVHSNQIPICAAAGEHFDQFYPSRRLVQSQDSMQLSCYVDAEGAGQIITTAGPFNMSALRGHRTVTIPGYNVSAEDFGIHHRGVPSAVPSGMGGPQAINFNLPPVKQITGTNPDGTASYLSKPFFIMKCDTSNYPVQVFPFGGEYVNGVDRKIINNPYEMLMLDALGDQWWAVRIPAA